MTAGPSRPRVGSGPRVPGRRRGRRRFVASLATVVTAVAACGSPADERIQAVADDDAPSPLNQLLGLDGESGGDLVEREVAAQELIRQCMADAGHRYIPIDADSLRTQIQATTGSEAELDADSEAYVEAEGYGLAERARSEIERAALSEGESAPATAVDPNDEVRAALSPAERATYDQALLGYSPTDIDLSSGAPVDTGTGAELSEQEWAAILAAGCQPKAYDEVFDLTESDTTRRFMSSIDQELGDMEQAFRADDRFAELQDDWVACMSGEGYSYLSKDEIFAYLEDQYSTLVRQVEADGLTSEIEVRLSEIEQEEITIAVADWSCSQDFFAMVGDIRREYELDFIEKNEGLFISYLDEVGR